MLIDMSFSLSSLVWPEPISPLFAPGGLLPGWNEDIVFTIAILALLGAVDVFICRPLLSPKSRYFCLHAVANAVSSIAAFPDVLRTLRDPVYAFSGPTTTMIANSAVISIHLYHCLFFKLPPADIFHHAVFVSILCGFAIPFKHVGGVSNNFGCFFLSGLPGGLNYVLLVLVKEGLMSALSQKGWDAWINTWLRGPSMSVYAFLQVRNACSCLRRLCRRLFHRRLSASLSRPLVVVSSTHLRTWACPWLATIAGRMYLYYCLPSLL